MPSLLFQTIVLIIQLGAALLVGFLAFRLGWVTEKQGLAFLTGRIGLPLLAFKAVTTADLDDMELGVTISCTIGKLFVYLLACAASWVCCRRESKDKKLISAAIFSFHVTAANDFVFGFPIIQAFYPDKGVTNLVANVVVQNVFFQVCSLSMLGVGTAQQRQAEADASPALNATSPRTQCSRTLKQLAQDPLLCAIALAVVYKAFARLIAPHAPGASVVPEPVSDVIDFFTKPFSTTALMLTGANLATALDRTGHHKTAGGSLYLVGVPIALVVAKNIICPYVTLAASELILPGSQNNKWHNFAFLYGSIPTSSAPMLVAMRVGHHIEVVAAAVSIGIMVAIPMLIASAVLLGRDTVDASRVEAELYNSQLAAMVVSVLTTSASLLLFRLHDRTSLWWSFPHIILVWYAFACFAHATCNLATAIALPVCDLFSARIMAYCEVQSYILIAMMALASLLNFKSKWHAKHMLWIAVLAPVPCCIWVPNPTVNKSCILGVGEASGFNLTVSAVGFVLISTLIVAGVLLRKRPSEFQPATCMTTLQEGLEVPLSPESPPPESPLDANTLVEFEPDSPVCYEHRSPGSRHSSAVEYLDHNLQDVAGTGAATGSDVPLGSFRGPFGPQLPVLPRQQTLDPMPSNYGGTVDNNSNLKFAILVIAAKALVVLAISTLVRSVLLIQRRLHQDTAPAFTPAYNFTRIKSFGLGGVRACSAAGCQDLESSLVLGLLVELLFEHSEGLFLLLVILCFFDTSCSKMARKLRHRRQIILARLPIRSRQTSEAVQVVHR